MKKALSLMLAVLLIICAFPVMSISAEETTADAFVVDTDHASTTTISGDAVKGYTMVLTGSGRTRAISTQSYPISTFSFDYGYNYSGNLFGEFGVSKIADVTNLDDGYSDANTLTFFYRVTGTQLLINVRWENKQEVRIGTFDYETYRPGDGYYSPNISNFSFVKVDGHWHLAVDGNICNTETDNFAYACLENMLGAETFENNEKVYPYVGGYNSGTVYFKQLSATSEDGAWESRAVDSYKYTFSGAVREYRGQGNTSETVHSAIPAAGTGTKESGHVVDFTGTDGYAQTTEGFDLKTTTFYIAPITYTGNTANLWYYLGFTADPSVIQYHSTKPGDTVEFRAASVYSNNYTAGYVVTNSSGTLASPTTFTYDRMFQWRTHRYEDTYANSYTTIKFVQDTGADGETHWYMQTTVSGSNIVVKSSDTANDVYLQFDSIIDKPVYFRMGTDGMKTDSFKMYCKIVDSEGNSAWAEKLPAISDEQTALVAEVQSGLSAIGTVTEENIEENYAAAVAIIENYDALTEDAKEYLTADEISAVESLRALVDAYVPVNFYVDANHVETTAITGDEVNGYTMTLSGTNRTRIITKKTYPISTLSFDYGYKYSGNLFGEFGVSKIADVTNLDDGYSDDNTLTFFYRVTGQQLIISVRWENLQEKNIGVFDFATYRPGDGYYSPNISNFSFVEVNGHWHLAVDGNVCNNVEENFDYSCLEYMLGEETFENNEEVYLYVGGYDSGEVYFKQLSATSEDGMWESRAVESYKYTFSGAVREYRGQGNTSETVHSAIPAAAVGSAAEGHLVDFTGTDGYAQTVSGYDLKTTTFHISPVTYDGNTANIWYYLGFTANPAALQYHSVKPGDSIELYAASVYSDNYTGGWLNTNPDGCYADASQGNIPLGRFGQWRTHKYNDNYTSAILHINFVQDTGADGNLHWYMQTTVSGTSIVIKSSNTADDVYLQFDSIIDKPVYFRMGSKGTTTDSFKMYCRIEGTKAVTVDPVYQNLDFGDFVVDYEDGATIGGNAYANGDTLGVVGEYELKYTEYETLYNRKLILYRPGDVNADNTINIIDLVALKKYIAASAELDAVGTKSADVDLSDAIDTTDLTTLRKTLLSGNAVALTGYTAASMAELVDFTVEVESGREMRVLQLTDPQIIESEQQRTSGRLAASSVERYSKDNKDEMYHKYLTDTITKSDPDLIIITGDLVYGEFDDNGEAFTEFVQFMDSFEIPWAPVFGNHENESKMGVDWQCEQLVNSEYALFKQRELTGNGNYTVGLKQDGVYKRVFFMLDSNGCVNASAESLANGHTATAIGFGDDQIAWYTDLAEKMRYSVPELKLSAAFHIQLSVFEKAYAKYGFTNEDTESNPINIDTIADAAEGDFGYIGTDLAGEWDTKENVWYGLKSSGFDSFYVGHVHRISASVVYRGVRFQFGQKSSTYDSANYLQADGTISSNYDGDVTPIIGGTTIPVNTDGSLGVGELVLYE